MVLRRLFGFVWLKVVNFKAAHDDGGGGGGGGGDLLPLVQAHNLYDKNNLIV